MALLGALGAHANSDVSGHVRSLVLDPPDGPGVLHALLHPADASFAASEEGPAAGLAGLLRHGAAARWEGAGGAAAAAAAAAALEQPLAGALLRVLRGAGRAPVGARAEAMRLVWLAVSGPGACVFRSFLLLFQERRATRIGELCSTC